MQPQLSSHSRRFVLFLLLAVLCLSLGIIFKVDPQIIQGQLQQFGYGPSVAIFLILYVGLTFLVWVGPKDILRIVGAALYGPYWSTLIVWFGEMGNAVVMFSLSRRLGREYVEQRLHGRWKDMDEAIARTSFWSIFFIRFFPVIPFRFSDLGFGLTRISLKKYLLICAVGSPLRIFIIQLFLSVGLKTVLQPALLADYLSAHPTLRLVVNLYLIGTFILIFVLKKRAVKQKDVPHA